MLIIASITIIIPRIIKWQCIWEAWEIIIGTWVNDQVLYNWQLFCRHFQRWQEREGVEDEEDENDKEEYFKINNEEDDIDDNDCSEEDKSKKWS